MNNYVQISIATTHPGESDILVALLSQTGFEGFEETGNTLHAFIAQDKFHEERMREILTSRQLEYSKKSIPEQNWNESWERHFQPVSVGDFCGIRAAFHEPMKNVQHEIIITPKMSFGTGHHDTTRLMIEAMAQINFKEKKVLDFGTGTGILAILAEQLGAAQIIAIDHDDWSIRNAVENIASNHCHSIELRKLDNPDFKVSFDIILANINKNVIISNLRFLSQHLQEEGVLLLSGLLSDDFGEIQLALATHHFSISYHGQSNNWICLRCFQAV
jgi:ribosomal protein L11 methyltransferase